MLRSPPGSYAFKAGGLLGARSTPPQPTPSVSPRFDKKTGEQRKRLGASGSDPEECPAAGEEMGRKA